MWKPGSAKPSSSNDGSGVLEQPPINVASPTDVASSTPSVRPNGSTSGETKKKLSGATLGMRFMQRRNTQSESTRKPPTNKPPHNSREQTMEVDDATDGESDGASNNEMESASSHLPQTATTSDMYGIKATLVGRRSFGGFNENVSKTWKCSLHAYTHGKAGERARKQHISDEELLNRYESYIKGRGSANLGEEIDEAAAAPIGNLQEKIKKKPTQRRKSASPQRGEKRKRP